MKCGCVVDCSSVTSTGLDSDGGCDWSLSFVNIVVEVGVGFGRSK